MGHGADSLSRHRLIFAEHRMLRSRGWWALAVVGSAVVGLTPVLLGPIATAVAAMLAIGVVGTFVLRRFATSGSRPGVQRLLAADAPEEAGRDETVVRAYRFPRILFYIGALTTSNVVFRPALGLTPSEVFFFGALGMAVLIAFRSGTIAPLPASLMVGAGLFSFGGGISSIGADNPTVSATETMQGIYVMLLWFWAALMVLRTVEHARIAVSLFTISAAVCGLGAIWQSFGFDFLTGPLEGGRATSWAGHPNDLGGMMAVALLPALALATTSWGPSTTRQRILRWLVVGLIGSGLVLSGSVGGMTGGIVGVIIWLAVPTVRVPVRAALAVGVVALVAGAGLMGDRISSPRDHFERVFTVREINDGNGSIENRMASWEAAWDRINDNPVVGTGLDGSGRGVTVTDRGATGTGILHGAPIAAWYIAGIFGLLGYLVVSWVVGLTGWRGMMRASNQNERALGWAMASGFFAFWIFEWSEPLVFTQYGWLVAVILIAWSARVVPVPRAINSRAINGPIGLRPRSA
jgi:hypothetical protein